MWGNQRGLVYVHQPNPPPGLHPVPGLPLRKACRRAAGHSSLASSQLETHLIELLCHPSISVSSHTVPFLPPLKAPLPFSHQDLGDAQLCFTQCVFLEVATNQAWVHAPGTPL